MYAAVQNEEGPPEGGGPSWRESGRSIGHARADSQWEGERNEQRPAREWEFGDWGFWTERPAAGLAAVRNTATGRSLLCLCGLAGGGQFRFGRLLGLLLSGQLNAEC
jgi:hypothetical protein